ncbi:hypothetical protein DITRI_Ditri06bG0124200 [Diplodiscus trichospermus]
MDDGRDSPPAKPAKTDEAVKPQGNLDFAEPRRYSIHDLEAFTNNFDKNSMIGLTQFGQLYRGKLEETGKEARFVTIKKWSDLPTYYPCTHDIDVMLNEELKFLTQPNMKSHPNLVKLIGYCREEQMKGVIYDLNPMDTLHNVMTKAGMWGTYSDVYSYGVIVIELITKRVTENEDLFRGGDSTREWATRIFESGKSLEVHPSLQQEQGYEASDGRFLVELGKCCLEFHPDKRPIMAKIVRFLEHMKVVKNHGNEVGL